MPQDFKVVGGFFVCFFALCLVPHLMPVFLAVDFEWFASKEMFPPTVALLHHPWHSLADGRPPVMCSVGGCRCHEMGEDELAEARRHLSC